MQYISLFGTRLFCRKTAASFISTKIVLLPPDFSGILPDELSLEEAVLTEQYRASFAFFSKPQKLGTRQDVLELAEHLDKRIGTSRWILWENVGLEFSQLEGEGSFITERNFRAEIIPLVTFSFSGSAAFLWDREQQGFYFDHRVRFQFSNYYYGDDPFSDKRINLETGQFTFDFTVQNATYFSEAFHTGFDYAYPQRPKADQSLSFSAVDGYLERMFHLHSTLDFCIAGNMVMRFKQPGISVRSRFTTVYGEQVVLVSTKSAGFSFSSNPCPGSESELKLWGDYLVDTDHNTHRFGILCGSMGTEYFILPEGLPLRFGEENSCGAYAPKYPAAELSINDFVCPADLLPLSNIYTTAWVRLPKGSRYYSQPSDNPYYCGDSSLLSYAPFYSTFEEDSSYFPMVPGTGEDEKEKRAFESAVIAPTRATILGRHLNMSGSCASLANKKSETATIAAPSGYVMEMKDGRVNRIFLSESVCFHEPSPELISVFNTSGMLLVAADGTAVKERFLISLSGWKLNFRIGNGSKNGILVVKNRKGKLYDPGRKEESLLGNPSLWTRKDTFSTSNPAKVATRLMKFFQEAFADTRNRVHYESLYSAACDESWRGYLFLDIPLVADDFPPELQPAFPKNHGNETVVMHYFCAEQIKLAPGGSGPWFCGSAEYCGFAGYTCQGYTGSPVKPVKTGEYEFRSLDLKAVFDKGEMKFFGCTSQLVLPRMFGLEPANEMDGVLLLYGHYVERDGKHVLSLEAEGQNNIFFGDENPVSCIFLDRVSLSGREGEEEFILDGSISFRPREDGDILSYEKLQFSGYRLCRDTSGYIPQLSHVTFDPANSRLRTKSLASAFSLTAQKAVCNPDGFSSIDYSGAPGQLDGLAGGIQLQAVLGTSGNLSADSPVLARILTGWDKDGRLVLGMKLPEVFPVEKVLSLSAGRIRLAYDTDNGFVLHLTNIALKALGLLKLPPNGSFSLAVYDGAWYAALLENN